MTITVTGDYTVPAGATATFGAGVAYGLQAPSSADNPTFTDAGTIQLSSSGADDSLDAFATASTFFGQGTPLVHIASGGSVSVIATGAGSSANAFQNEANYPTDFVNDGSVDVEGVTNAIGAYMYGGHFINNGDFSVSGAAVNGVDANGLASFVNTGTFEVASTSSNALGLGVITAPVSITNSGTITVTSQSANAYGLYLQDTNPYLLATETIENSGTITATTAVYMTVPRSVNLNNSGVINGDVVLTPQILGQYTSPQTEQVVNTGHIYGAVHLDGATEIYNGAQGTVSGAIYLGSGSGTVTGGAGAETVYGGSGDDLIDGGGGDDLLDGGGGINTVSFASAGAGVTVSLALQGQAQHTGEGNKTLSNFQNLTGSTFNDVLTGDANDNIIDGGGGNDVIDGGGGIDTLSFASATVGVTFSLALQGLAQNTGAGTDTVTNVQNLLGSTRPDHLIGDANNNVIDGGGGDDVLDGGGGTNTVSFGSATTGVTVSLALQGQAQTTGVGSVTLTNFQALIGSAYNDTLTAANGTSTLTGGAGADSFQIQSDADTTTITDFSDGQDDKIILCGLQTLTSWAAIQAAAQQMGPDTVVNLGPGTLTLKNVQLNTLTAADFVLGGPYPSTQVSGHTAIAAGQTLTYIGANNGFGAYLLTGQGLLTVDGTLNVQDSGAGDVLSGVNAGGSTGSPVFWIDPSGVVSVAGSGSGSNAAGFYAASAAGFENQGTFSVSSGSAPMGVDLGAGGAFTNTGTITVSGQAGSATGLYAGGAVQAANSGQMTVTGAGQVDGFHLLAGATLHNSGTITATSTGAASYGVLVGDSSGGASTVYNTGTITALYAVNTLVGPGHLILWNSGAIDGNVVLGTAAGNELHNNSGGSISGSVTFDGTSGQQLYNGVGGTLSGSVTFVAGAGATGTDLAYLGNDGETVHGGSVSLLAYGGTGADHIVGGAGNDVIGGGGGNDLLDGGGGINGVDYAAAANGVTVSLALQGQAQDTGDGVDTLTNFQNLYGSNFDDHLTGDANDNYIDGQGGNDVIDGGGGFNTIGFTTAANGVSVSLALQGQTQDTRAGSDTLTNFQAIIGSAYNDTLEGGDGGIPYTFLTGGAGADTFVYRPSDGNVTIMDFSDAQDDRISLVGVNGIHTLSDVLAYGAQSGSDTVFNFGGEILRLAGVSMASLMPADFGLTSAAGPTVGPGIGGTPTTGNGMLNGGSGSDWLQGGAGNDTLHGGAGSDYLDGGAGLNTALYDGAYRLYVVSAAAGTVSGGPEGGMDVLTNIQRIQFVDGYLAVSPTDFAGQVYRVYEATLGRAPDEEGLTNWVDALNGGSSLQSVVDGFVGSQEFQADYGANLSNAQFVTLLYNNVLHRGPDPAGLANWVGLLASGQDARAQVVTGFSESQEDINDLAAPVQQGLWIGDAAAGEVARLYDTVLARLPDAGGLANWTHVLESGGSLQGVADGFVGSQEFQQTYGNLSNTDFVTLLYHNVLHRLPDAAGLNNWVAALATGESRAQVVVGFSESPEHIANTAAHIDSGIWVAG
jgi:Ca2+-binding RTX toxin-like protein